MSAGEFAQKVGAGSARALVISTAGLLLASTLAASAAQAGSLLSPPGISDRKVDLAWEPDVDDPVFNGNTVLERVSTFDLVHAAGRDVVSIAGLRNTSELLSYAVGDAALTRWSLVGGSIVSQYPLGAATGIADVTVHASNRWALAGSADGSVHLWDLDVPSSEPRQSAVVSSGAVRVVRFYPTSTDPSDVRFAAAGAEDTIRVFQDLDATRPLIKLAVQDGGTSALQLIPTPSGMQLAAGGAGTRVRVWEIASQPQSPRLRLEGHQGTIVDLAYTADFRRLASVDDRGEVRIWSFATGELLGVGQSDPHANPAHLGFSSPDGQILFVSRGDGTVELRNGVTAEFYRSEPIATAPVTAFLMFVDGRRALLGDENGRFALLRGGRCIPTAVDPVCFGGYKIWRSPTRSGSDAVLLRSYNFDDSTWTFVGEGRAFTDPDSMIARRNPPDPGQEGPIEDAVLAGPHNGIPYFYSLTRFNRRYLNGAIFDELAHPIEQGFYRDPGASIATPIVARARARTETPLLTDVYTVPNPYELGRVPWEISGAPHVEFRNLPARAKIKLYTVAGDLIRELVHGPDQYGDDRAVAEWDLKNSSGRLVVPGVYVYQVEAQNGEVVQGYLALVR